MTRRRLQRTALVALAGLLLAVGGVRLAETLGERDRQPAVPVQTVSDGVLFDESFSVRPGGALGVNLGSEAVVVKTVSGDRARVVVKGEGRDAAEEFLRRQFSARTVRGGLEVKTDPPRRRSMGRTDARFTVTVEVPRRYSVAVDLGSGAVSVASLDGDVDVDTGSGAVRVGEVSGDVSVETGSGAVRVGRAGGRLAVDTGSGGVAVGEAAGRVSIDTGSGGVTLAVTGGGPVSVSTGSGGATVAVPRRSGWDVDLDGSSVRIDGALGFDGQQSRGRARGRIGRGGPALSVDTGSGGITVRAR